ncbi:hypothetical protein JI58_08620 [Marinosulfonomonas sp. PRT-SC04]|nr:hypothetical protein JI58_08620 [Marinosulfonomonas sp. PRT-SC04]
MSEPVSNVEIEDVLSSIRRLVSNDVAATQTAAVTGPVVEAPTGKLILTADFRVSKPIETPSEAVDAADVEPDTADEPAQPEAAEAAPIEFHHSEQPAEEHDAEGCDDVEAEFKPSVEAVNTEFWHDPNALLRDAPSFDETTSPLEDTIAELEATIGQQDGEWEPDGSDFEEDADAEEMMSEPVQDWIDGSAKDLDVEAAVEVSDAADEDPDLFGDSESVIDEETLRDMVSDIVRQELQGALGERITRYVRKLVRREINRVLASQDFD